MNIPNTLKTKIQEGRLIPVVCAGVSMAIKNKEGQNVFPSWPTLLERAAKVALDENKEGLSTAISALVPLNKLQQAAELAKEALIGDNWNDFLEKQFDVDLEQLDSSSSSLQKALWKLSRRHITLNYDHCLEWANDCSANLSYFDNSSTRQLKKFKANDITKDMVWHLHGTIKEPEHLVLTPESYNRLYGKGGEGEYAAALSALNEIMSSDNLLFVGSSMSDVELLAELGNQNKLFSGNTGPHYVLVREKQKEETIKTLGELTNVIEVLTFSDFGDPLVEAIEELASHTSQKKKIVDTLDDGGSAAQPNDTCTSFDSVSIHLANPIDKPHDYDHLTKFTKGFKCHVEKHYLSSDSLWNESDYTFIFTSLTKNGFLVEDESCCSDYLSIEEFLDELPLDTKGVFIFVDDIPVHITKYFIEDLTELPVAIYQVDKDCKKQRRTIDKAPFQLFRKHILDLTNVSIIANQDSFNLSANLSGKHYLANNITTKLNNVDKSSVTKFIGRSSDLSSISREIIRIENKNLALVLKGSGGVGKTTIANKLAVEYSKRGKYEQGITFIDCEPISSYEQFYQQVTRGFCLASILDLEQHLINNNFDNNRLIILDNYESILNLDDDRDLFINLTGIITEFSSLIITSRDRIQEQWGQELSLRSLDSLEGVELFNYHTKNTYNSKKEQLFLREEIVENLLDCNPLAIEIVSSNIPPGKVLHDLEKDLIKEFESIDDTTYYLTAKSDSNINRKKSLLGSINYSYNTLNDIDKRAIELISLFPDGISLRNLREITENKKNRSNFKFYISDRTIKSLSDKSLLINSGNDIKLHSIVSRFTLSKAKNNESNQMYWERVAKYNFSFMNSIEEIYINYEPVALELTTSYLNNFLLLIENIGKIEIDDELIDDIFSYVFNVIKFSTSVCIFKPVNASLIKFKKELDEISWHLEDEYKTLLSLFFIVLEYRKGNYNSALESLEKVSPISSIVKSCELYSMQFYINELTIGIYNVEGYVKECFEYSLESRFYGCFYPYFLLSAGVISSDIIEICDVDYSYFEAKRISGTLDFDEISKHLDYIHPQEFYQQCVVRYIINKEFTLSEMEVSKIVSTTPVTSGLKLAMRAKIKSIALNKNDSSHSAVREIKELYERSIQKTVSSKYLHLSVLQDYCEFLKANELKDDFESVYNMMVLINGKSKFPYWEHEISRLKDTSIPVYSPIENQSPYGMDTSKYAKEFIKDTIRVKKLSKL
ncbi:SIR2 family protein [Vibrio cyclitrophicus]